MTNHLFHFLLFVVISLGISLEVKAEKYIPINHPKHPAIENHLEVNFSPDSRRLITLGNGSQNWYIWDVTDGTLIKKSEDTRDFYDCQMSPTGKYIIACSFGQNLHIYDGATYKLLNTIHHEYVNRDFPNYNNNLIMNIRITSDEKILYSQIWGTIFIWDIETGKNLAIYKDTGLAFPNCFFLPNSNIIFQYQDINISRFLDVLSGKIVKEISKGIVLSIVGKNHKSIFGFTSDGHSNIQIVEIDIEKMEISKINQRIKHSTANADANAEKGIMLFSKNYITGNQLNVEPVALYDFNQDKYLTEFKGYAFTDLLNSKPADDFKLSPDCNYAAYSMDGAVYLFDISDLTSSVKDFDTVKN